MITTFCTFIDTLLYHCKVKSPLIFTAPPKWPFDPPISPKPIVRAIVHYV